MSGRNSWRVPSQTQVTTTPQQAHKVHRIRSTGGILHTTYPYVGWQGSEARQARGRQAQSRNKARRNTALVRGQESQLTSRHSSRWHYPQHNTQSRVQTSGTAPYLWSSTDPTRQDSQRMSTCRPVTHNTTRSTTQCVETRSLTQPSSYGQHL